MTEDRHQYNNSFPEGNESSRISSSRSSSMSSRRMSSSSSSTTTTTTTIHTDPGVSYKDEHVFVTEEQWENLARYYEDCIGSYLTPPIMKMLYNYMDYCDIPYEVIMKAIEVTAFAPRPTPYYLRGILERCAGDGIYSIELWNEAEQNYRYGKKKRWYDRGTTDFMAEPGTFGYREQRF